jgi:hypothetical protein
VTIKARFLRKSPTQNRSPDSRLSPKADSARLQPRLHFVLPAWHSNTPAWRTFSIILWADYRETVGKYFMCRRIGKSSTCRNAELIKVWFLNATDFNSLTLLLLLRWWKFSSTIDIIGLRLPCPEALAFKPSIYYVASTKFILNISQFRSLNICPFHSHIYTSFPHPLKIKVNRVITGLSLVNCPSRMAEESKEVNTQS